MLSSFNVSSITWCQKWDDNASIYLSLLQIKLTPGLLSPATLLLNRPSRGILPRFSTPPIVCKNDESNHTAIVNRQPHASKYVDTHKNICPIYRINFTSTARRWGPWMHGTIVGCGTEDYRGRNYKMRVKKIRCTTTWYEETHEGHPLYQCKSMSGMRCQSQQSTKRW